MLPDDGEVLFNSIVEVDFKKINSFNDIKGVVKVLYYSEFFEELYTMMISKGLSNYTLIMDDPIFLQVNTLPFYFKKILQRKRQFSVDVICTSHSIDQIANYMFDYINLIYLGFTDGEILNRKNKLGRKFEIIYNAKKHIDSRAGKNKNKANYYSFKTVKF